IGTGSGQRLEAVAMVRTRPLPVPIFHKPLCATLFAVGGRGRRPLFGVQSHSEMLNEFVEELLGGPRCVAVRMTFSPLQGEHQGDPAVQSLRLGRNTEAGQADKKTDR